ncbi:DEKNAAC104318 [Brettanomyces naardenensis]|uniref:DEKNAAC104318 n=1 Tax=Brettanomyces naardenensis TaxID=13370 RepID=A0A448YQL3_BRENA|nr:DEKNAAC104318 [Brettanomyces naardenensis]
MKFAKTFQKVLSEETLPPEWVDKAIQYKALKKIINKTVTELESVGVSRDEMTIDYEISKLQRRMRPVLRMNVSPLAESLIKGKLDSLGYKYNIKPLQTQETEDLDEVLEETDELQNERLVSSLHSDSGTINNDDVTPNKSESTLSSQTSAPPSMVKDSSVYKEPALPTIIHEIDDDESFLDQASVQTSIVASVADYLSTPLAREPTSVSVSSLMTALNPFDDKPFYEITVSLHEDAKFFQTLYEEIEALNDFSDERENEIMQWVEKIASIVAHASSPDVKKNDLYVWRQIFQIYIDSQIFFSTIERSAGANSNAVSRIRYGKFLEKIEEEQLVTRFKQKESLAGFMEFKELNESILKVANFQTMNIMAISKILKKFDKRTHFKSKQMFPELIQRSEQLNILQNSMGRDLCTIMTNRLLNIVPQVEDYTCPICCSVAYKPIRLNCGHLFCVRCLVKLQRKGEDRCPLCRQDVVMKADEGNLDVSLMEYLKLYFPKEVKIKQAENEKEIFKEQFGSVVDPDAKACVIV